MLGSVFLKVYVLKDWMSAYIAVVRWWYLKSPRGKRLGRVGYGFEEMLLISHLMGTMR